MRRIISLILGDFRIVRRDATFLMSLLAPLIIAVLAKVGLPLLTKWLYEKFSFDLADYYKLILSFIIVLIPFILGLLSGLLLLDEKDENILSYIAVTPVTREGYIIYKIMSPVVVSALCSLLAVMFIGIQAVNVATVIPVIMLSALEAPLVALFLAKFASNKIEGLAYTKGTGLILFVPVVAYFWRTNWNLLLGIFPTYWVGNSFMASFGQCNAYLWYIGGGFLVHGIYLFWLYRKG
jgi:fluoroquinolone transport system permease protein